MAEPRKVLFLCTGNSARSILAEHLLRHLGRGRFETYSAGAAPKGEVHPLALEVLREVYGIDAAGARSKSWQEYRGVAFDFVITVCDHARESCPLWPGEAIVAHWSMPDPAAAGGPEEARRAAFERAARDLHRRLELFRDLPLEAGDRPRLQQLIAGIGGR